MKKLILILLSALPLLLGFLVNQLILVVRLAGWPVYIIGFLILLAWFFLGTYSSKVTSNPFEAIFLGNFVGIFSFTLLIIQLFALGDFSQSWIGILPYIYFLPTMGAVAFIDVFNWIHSIPMFFIINLSMMIGVYYLGFRTKNKNRY